MDNVQAAGVGRPFEHKGTTYTARPLTVANFCEFEAWLRAEAFQEVERTRHLLTEETYRDSLREVTRDVATKQYAWGGELYQKAVRTVPGIRRLFELSVGSIDEEAAFEITRRRTADVVRLLRELNPDDL